MHEIILSFLLLLLLLRGPTFLEEPWPFHMLSVCEVTPRPTPNLEDQWTTLSLTPARGPVWLG